MKKNEQQLFNVGDLVLLNRTINHVKGMMKPGLVGLVTNLNTDMEDVYGICFFLGKLKKTILCHGSELIIY